MHTPTVIPSSLYLCCMSIVAQIIIHSLHTVLNLHSHLTSFIEWAETEFRFQEKWHVEHISGKYCMYKCMAISRTSPVNRASLLTPIHMTGENEAFLASRNISEFSKKITITLLSLLKPLYVRFFLPLGRLGKAGNSISISVNYI